MTYQATRRDFEYLETLGELDDWVTLMDDIEQFMQNPTKQFAERLYLYAIDKWFDQHGLPEDKRARRIATKYGHYCARALS